MMAVAFSARSGFHTEAFRVAALQRRFPMWRDIVAMVRYAELFSYDDQARTFALAPAAP